MRQRSMRPWLWTVFVVMAVGMTACSGVPRGHVSSFEAPFAGHPGWRLLAKGMTLPSRLSRVSQVVKQLA
jgi:hypothetical protein